MSATANETNVSTASKDNASSDNADSLQQKVLALTFNQDSTYELSIIDS
jgi:hypothetical protein